MYIRMLHHRPLRRRRLRPGRQDAVDREKRRTATRRRRRRPATLVHRLEALPQEDVPQKLVRTEHPRRLAPGTRLGRRLHHPEVLLAVGFLPVLRGNPVAPLQVALALYGGQRGLFLRLTTESHVLRPGCARITQVMCVFTT